MLYNDVFENLQQVAEKLQSPILYPEKVEVTIPTIGELEKSSILKTTKKNR